MNVLRLLILVTLAFSCGAETESTTPQRKACTSYDECVENVETCSDEGVCVPYCGTNEDCPSDLPFCTTRDGNRHCTENDESLQPCEPRAVDGTCTCGSPNPGFLVSGSGTTCEIVEEVTVCFRQRNTCLNSCVDEFFAFDLGDGTRLIAAGLQGDISPGWIPDGQGGESNSCPAITQNEENNEDPI